MKNSTHSSWALTIPLGKPSFRDPQSPFVDVPVSKVPANNTTPFLQLKTKQRKKVTMKDTISFKMTSKICILVSGKEDILQLNLRDSPSGSVAEPGVQCTASVGKAPLQSHASNWPGRERGFPSPHCMKDCELRYLTRHRTQRQAIRKGSSGESEASGTLTVICTMSHPIPIFHLP